MLHLEFILKIWITFVYKELCINPNRTRCNLSFTNTKETSVFNHLNNGERNTLFTPFFTNDHVVIADDRNDLSFMVRKLPEEYGVA